MALFTHDELIELLDALIDKLVAAGASGTDVRVVGGAAIALAHDPERDATGDIDALGATNRAMVEAAVAALSEERGLPSDWLNFKVAMYAPDPDRPEPSFETLRERDGVRISVGTAQLLLAMKLRAGRGRRDIDDVDVLLDARGITTVEEAVALFEAHYSAEVMPERSMLHLRQRFAAG